MSFFYFMSGFICMFGLIKKYQRDCDLSQDANDSGDKSLKSINESQITNNCIPRLNKRALLKQILGRWVRLAIPAYLLILFTATIFPFLGSGPSFMYIYQQDLLLGMQEYWYSWLLFIQNWTPWNGSVGIYWVYFVANDLQFYAVILMPLIYFYLKRKRRLTVLICLVLLVVGNMVYLFTVTMLNDYSSMLNFTVNEMYKDFYKRPMGVMGYYAFGILLSICYFEY